MNWPLTLSAPTLSRVVIQMHFPKISLTFTFIYNFVAINPICIFHLCFQPHRSFQQQELLRSSHPPRSTSEPPTNYHQLMNVHQRCLSFLQRLFSGNIWMLMTSLSWVAPLTGSPSTSETTSVSHTSWGSPPARFARCSCGRYSRPSWVRCARNWSSPILWRRFCSSGVHSQGSL